MGEPVKPWPLDATVLPADWDPAALSDAQAAAVQIASELLWRATAQGYGLRDHVVRPVCAANAPLWSARLRPGWGSPTHTGCVSGADLCGGCGDLIGIPLPGPVAAVAHVWVDGVELREDAYDVYDARTLTRLDGELWPTRQRLDLPPTEVGTFAVAYTRGVEPPAGGRRAVTILAVEVARAAAGDKGCRLPQRVQTLTREGVSFTMLDPLEFLERGRTGIADVDRWLAAVNPQGATQPSQVVSPDVRR